MTLGNSKNRDNRMDEVSFVDTTLRDGHQSLWAEGMLTGMILPVAARLDRAGFDAIELVAPSFFKKACREFKEDIWERIRLVRQRVTRTPLRGIRNRYMAGFQVTPACASKLWLERLAANGIGELRSSDPSNTVANWSEMVRSASAVGLNTIVNLIFSESPKHTDDYYVERARQAALLKPARICLKDPDYLNFALQSEARQKELALFAPAFICCPEERASVSLNTTYYGQFKSKCILGVLEEFLIRQIVHVCGDLQNSEKK